MSSNLHKDHRRRMKERFLKEGFDGFAEHNILELLLFYAIPQKDTNELAHLLLKRFGSFHRVLDAPYEELLTIKGVGENAAVFLKILPQAAKVYFDREPNQRTIYDSSEKLGQFFVRKFIGTTQECVYILLLDNALQDVGFEVLSRGMLSSATIETRKVVEAVVRTGAQYVVLSHNHPTAPPEPSNDDIVATSYLQNALRTIDTELLDHIIVSGRSYRSLSRLGYCGV